MTIVHDAEKGIKEIHNIHVFQFGDFSGSWGAGFVIFLNSRPSVIFVISELSNGL